MRMKKFQVVILVHVDDRVILSFQKDGVKWVIEKLRSSLKLTDLGDISYYLGVTFERKRKIVCLR